MVCNSELVYVKGTLGISLMMSSCSCLALYKAILYPVAIQSRNQNLILSVIFCNLSLDLVHQFTTFICISSLISSSS